MRHDLGRRARRDDLPPMDACRRADVDHMVGKANRVLVVLHDDHRIADVAQMPERAEKALVVALMQAD